MLFLMPQSMATTCGRRPALYERTALAETRSTRLTALGLKKGTGAPGNSILASMAPPSRIFLTMRRVSMPVSAGTPAARSQAPSEAAAFQCENSGE